MMPNPGAPDWIIPVKRLVTTGKAGAWCRLPYPGHPQGCPNYGRRAKCPPHAPRVDAVFDLAKPLFLVHSVFQLEAHAHVMKVLHPEWSERQCRCVLYWQEKSRAELRARIRIAWRLLRTTACAEIPEALGVNVYVTARQSGLHLDKIRNLKVCRHVALLGTLKDGIPW